MRLRLVGLGVAFGICLVASNAQAQDTGFSDPFFLYYGYFLPRQNALASQPQPEDFYRNQSVQRQYSAQTDVKGLYDTSSYLGQDELNPLSPFGLRSGSTRMVRTVATGLPTTARGPSHNAPSNRFLSHGAYFPTIRSGSGRRPPGSGAAAGLSTAGAAGYGGGTGRSPLIPPMTPSARPR